MKKKLLIFGLFLLLIIPFKAKAAYSYRGTPVYISDMKSKGWITTWPEGTYVKVGADPVAQYKLKPFFYFHQVYDSSSSYSVICTNVGKNASNEETGDVPLQRLDDLTKIKDSSNNAYFTDAKRKLLEELLVNGYHYDTTNTKHINKIGDSQEDTLAMIAMQFIVWEIAEGSRTSFDTVAPNAYNPSNSAYNVAVYPNGGSNNKVGSLYYYYKKIIDDTRSALNPTDAPAFNKESYTMAWDATNKRYSVSVTGLGKYKTCKSSSTDVRIDTTTNGITLISTKPVSNVKIDCSYSVGSGTQDVFYFFKFNNVGTCLGDNSCQNLVYGTGRKVYSKNFNVNSENTKMKIKKVGMDKKELSGAKFRLTHRTTTSYTLDINANNSNATTIEKSGEYIVSEISVPVGYEKIKDFNITIDARTGKITNCSNKGTSTSGNTTCLGGQVEVGYENNVIVLKVADVAKNFKILKVDENNNPVKGATFEIYNSSNQLMKFTLYAGNVFGYNASGNLSSIRLDNSYSYPVGLLPEGEYKIVETNVSAPYRLSSNREENTTKIRINANRDMLVYDSSQNTYVASVDATVKVVNHKTLIKVKKIGGGKALEGVKFLLYNANRSSEIKCTLSSAGHYIYNENQSTGDNTIYVTNSTGYIEIENLPVGTYYFREIETIGNYVLPEGEAAYTKAVIDMTKTGQTINGSKTMNTIVISNSLATFNFYKVDEEGNYLTTGKFKLQRYDNEKNRYVDIKLIQVENDGTYDENADLFKESKDGKIQFGLTNGIATFIDMKPSTKYRIVETVAPDGYVKQPVSDTANVTLDEFGNASGLLVLTNQKVLKEDGQAQAELVVNIQTGQTKVKYAVLIGGIILIIGALVFIQRNKK